MAGRVKRILALGMGIILLASSTSFSTVDEVYGAEDTINEDVETDDSSDAGGGDNDESTSGDSEEKSDAKSEENNEQAGETASEGVAGVTGDDEKGTEGTDNTKSDKSDESALGDDKSDTANTPKRGLLLGNSGTDDPAPGTTSQSGEGGETPAEPQMVQPDEISIEPTSFTYNEEEQWPSVIYNETTLEKDTDYTIVCAEEKTPVNADQYTAIITLQGNYTSENPIEKPFEIGKASQSNEDLSAPLVEATADTITITGTIDTYEYQLVGTDTTNVDSTAPGEDSWESVPESGTSIVKEDLLPGKPYVIFYRLKETENYLPSDWLKADIVTYLVVAVEGDTTNADEMILEGHTLSATVTGATVNEQGPGPYTYKWFRDADEINGATAETYTLTKDDVGHKIKVKAVRGEPFVSEGESEYTNEIKGLGRTVNVTSVTGGAVEIRTSDIKTGTKVKIYVRPSTGYKLKDIEVAVSGGGTVNVEKIDSEYEYEFVQPDENVTVTPVYYKNVTADEAKAALEIDYSAETIIVKEGLQYEIALTDTSQAGTESIMDLSNVIDNATFNVYVRDIVDTSGLTEQSSWVAVPINGRPAAPQVSVTDTSGKSNRDGKITSSTSGLEYKLKTSKYYVALTTKTKVVAGTYLVRIAATNSSFASTSVEVTVNYKGSTEIVASVKPQGKKLTYNGKEQDLITRGSAKGGKIVYSTSQSGSYSNTIPKARDAGSYTVWWKVVDEKTNKETSPESVSTTIARKQVSVTGRVTAQKIYDGNTSAPVDWSKLKLTGVASGDSVSVSGTATFEDAQIGANKKINVTGLSLSGSSSGNYQLKSTSMTGVGSITDKNGLTGEELLDLEEQLKGNKKTNNKKTTSKNTKNTRKTRSTTSINTIRNLSPEERKLYDKLRLKEALMFGTEVDEYGVEFNSGGVRLKGADASVRLSSRSLSASEMPKAERSLIESSLSAFKSYKPGMQMLGCMDVSIYQDIGGDTWEQVEETEKPMELVFELSEEDRELGENFYVLRIHEGKTRLLTDEDQDPETCTVSSNRFSTYVLMCENPALAVNKTPDNKYLILTVPRQVIWWFVSSFIVIAGCMVSRQLMIKKAKK